MRIQSIGAFTVGDVQFSTLFAVEKLEARTFVDGEGKTQTKLSPDGRVVFRTPLKALAVADGVPVREERNVSVSVLEQVRLLPGVLYGLDGLVWLTPYNAGGNVGISIVAERVVPVGDVPVYDVGSLAQQMSAGGEKK